MLSNIIEKNKLMDRKLTIPEKKFLKDKNNINSVFLANDISSNLFNGFSQFFSGTSIFSKDKKGEKKVAEKKEEKKEESFFGSFFSNFASKLEEKSRQLVEILKYLSMMRWFVDEKAYNQMCAMLVESIYKEINIQENIKKLFDNYTEYNNKNNELSNFISNFYEVYASYAPEILKYFNLDKKLSKEFLDLLKKVSFIFLIANMLKMKSLSFIGILFHVGLAVIKLALNIFYGIIEGFIELISFVTDLIFKIIEFIIDFIIVSFKIIKAIISFLIRNIIKIFKAIIRAIKKIWKFIKHIGKKIWEFIKNFAKKLLEKIVDLANIVKNFILKLVKMIGKCVFKLFNLILDSFSLPFCIFFPIFAISITAMIFFLRTNTDIPCDCQCHSEKGKLVVAFHPILWIPGIFGLNKVCEGN